MVDKKTGDDEELEIVNDESDNGEVVEIEDKKEKEKPEVKDKEEDSEEDEQSLGHSDSDEDEDRPPKKNSRRQREKAARTRDKKEIEFLRIRNQDLENRFGELELRTATNEVVGINQRIEAVQSQIAMADEVIASAVDQKQGKDHVEAMRIRERLVKNLERLQEAKTQLESRDEGDNESTSRKQPTAPRAPIEVIVNARVWRKSNPWWTPGGKDKDSRVIARIDTEVSKEGFDPRSDEYWEELTERAKEALPHRYDGSDADDDDNREERRPVPPKKKNGGPRFSTGGREESLRPNQVHISAERKAAMIEAGVWEDTKLRSRYLKSFQKYDREKSGRSA